MLCSCSAWDEVRLTSACNSQGTFCSSLTDGESLRALDVNVATPWIRIWISRLSHQSCLCGEYGQECGTFNYKINSYSMAYYSLTIPRLLHCT